MSFNQSKKQSPPPPKTCKDCDAFEPTATYPEGICILNPPQVIVENGELYSSFPTVHAEVQRCLQIRPRKRPLVIPQEDENE